MQVGQNCPDFEFVEYALYEAPDWAAQYEQEHRLTIIDANGTRHVVEVDSDGDEVLNRVFFQYLCDLLIAPKTLDAIAAPECCRSGSVCSC